MSRDIVDRLTTRRNLLRDLGMTTLAGGLLSSSGCLDSLDSLAEDSSQEASLTIKMPPADSDPAAVRIAKHLKENLEKAGIKVTLMPESYGSLFEDVLIENNYDLYVAEHPGGIEPDFARTLFYSSFIEEMGWQNPLGYSDIEVDELLEKQMEETGYKRKRTLEEIQHLVVQDNPLSVIGFTDERRAVSEEKFTGWLKNKLHTFFSYLSLEKTKSAQDAETLEVVLSDNSPTQDLNPLTAYRNLNRTVIELIYDSLGKWKDGSIHPWMAESWEWHGKAKEGLSIEVNLRSRLTWHDAEAITSDDITFTYRVFKDMTPETRKSIPAPNFRQFSSLVDSVEAIDMTTARIDFVPCSSKIAKLALTIPLLPKHIWEKKAVSEEGIGSGIGSSKLTDWDNTDPVGSGPLMADSVSKNTELRLKSFKGHFLNRQNLNGFVNRFGGKPVFDELIFNVVPSDAVAVEDFMKEGRGDMTGTSLEVKDVPRVAKAEDLRLIVDSTQSFYHLGFNNKRKLFTNPRFRRAVSQLLDKNYIAENIFNGYIQPATTFLSRTRFASPKYDWEGRDSELPFAGENGTGEISEKEAKQLFRDAGYKYNDKGELLVR